jgi:hypothetical protein
VRRRRGRRLCPAGLPADRRPAVRRPPRRPLPRAGERDETPVRPPQPRAFLTSAPTSGTRLALIAMGEDPMCLRVRLVDDEWTICRVCHRPVRAQDGRIRTGDRDSPVCGDCVSAARGRSDAERPGTNDRVVPAPAGPGQGEN